MRVRHPGALAGVRDGTPAARSAVPASGPCSPGCSWTPGRVVPVRALIEDVWGGAHRRRPRRRSRSTCPSCGKTLGAAVLRHVGRGLRARCRGRPLDAAPLPATSWTPATTRRHWHCGEARRWPTCPTCSSPPPNGPACEELRLVATERGLEADLSAGRNVDAVAASAGARRRRIPFVSGSAGCSCWPSTGPGARWRRCRRSGATGVAWPTRWASTRPTTWSPCDEAILRHDPSLDAPRSSAGVDGPSAATGNLRLPASSFVGRDTRAAAGDGCAPRDPAGHPGRSRRRRQDTTGDGGGRPSRGGRTPAASGSSTSLA